ncbi:hypothetical protein [Sphingomonas morindae]|uniref:Uncharacterized protein n=1 Tax=Sphingomonas morindae TaxID=1541170 RepID=A0ABY4X719_9SPHN|nr:hypothetical protein [Sphingomonas morindae]USI72718.1 hypothetical protein LHA26_15810 [Sphingomonas morindae]
MIAFPLGAWSAARALFGAHRSYLTLLLVAVAAAGLYAWGAVARRERDQLAAWADRVCASAGEGFAAAKDTEGKAHPRGQLCAAQVARLARYQRDVTAESARVYAAELARRDAQTRSDTQAARAATAAATRAAQAMETANAKVGDDDRVDGGWFRALNAVGGLRAPGR